MAPVPTVKMRVLRSFFLTKNDLKVKDSIADIPVGISRMLVTDGKAEFVRDLPPARPAAQTASSKGDDSISEPPAKKTEHASRSSKEK